MIVCKACDGKGYIIDTTANGSILESICNKCHGSGLAVEEDKTLKGIDFDDFGKMKIIYRDDRA